MKTKSCWVCCICGKTIGQLKKRYNLLKMNEHKKICDGAKFAMKQILL